MSTTHSSPHDNQSAGRKVRILLAVLLVPLLVLTAVSSILLWPDSRKQAAPIALGPPTSMVDATVDSLELLPCNNDPAAGTCVLVQTDITSGPDRGDSVALTLPIGPGQPDLSAGDRIILGRTVDPVTGQVTYYFSDFQRRAGMVWLTAAFSILVVLVARWRGLGALIGLILTWWIVTQFMLPSILEGKSPVAVALTGGAAIVLVVLYVAHGLNARTTTAVIGTLISLGLVGLLSMFAVELTHVTGLSSEEATYVQNFAGRVNVQGLLLAGMIIGALGVLNDMTVSQASSVWEIHRAQPGRSRLAIYKSGMRVGRDHIASTVYTLVLAYTGAALPLLILFTLTNRGFAEVATSDIVAEELAGALVGGIGIILSVPITTGLAAFVVKSRRLDKDDEDHHEAPTSDPQVPAPDDAALVRIPAADDEHVESPEDTAAAPHSGDKGPEVTAPPPVPPAVLQPQPSTVSEGKAKKKRRFSLRRDRSAIFRSRPMSRRERKFWEED